MKKTFASVLMLFFFSACATKNISIEAPAFTPMLTGAPAKSSPQDIEDYQTLLQLQKTRTKADCARGVSEVNINLENFYGPAYGPLTQTEVAKWTPLFNEFSSLAWPLIKAAKDKWQRPRPFITHSDISPCVKLEKSFSYPSGHAAMAYYYLEILEQLKPALKDSLTRRADQIAHDRNIVGVHYPSDVRDGKILGDEIYEFRKDEPRFKELLARAKVSN
jgi:acid phosphatase (class A)